MLFYFQIFSLYHRGLHFSLKLWLIEEP